MSCNGFAFELRFKSLRPWIPDKLPVDDTLGELQSGTMPDSDALCMPQQASFNLNRTNVCNYIPLGAVRNGLGLPYRSIVSCREKQSKLLPEKTVQGEVGYSSAGRRFRCPIKSKQGLPAA